MKKSITIILFSIFLVGSFSGKAQNSDTLTAIADVWVKTFGGGEGKNCYVKFDISSIPSGMIITDVYFQALVVKNTLSWDGDVKFMNVNNQNWQENYTEDTLWSYMRTDTVIQLMGFGFPMIGPATSVDIKQIFLRDYNLYNNYCTVFLKDVDDPTIAPMGGTFADDSDSLRCGNIFNDYIIMMTHENAIPATHPKLIVNYCIPANVDMHPQSQFKCNGDNAYMTISVSGDGPFTYQWQLNSGGGFTNVIDTGVYSGAQTDTLSFTGVPLWLDGYQFRCIATASCGSGDTSAPAMFTVNETYHLYDTAYICQGEIYYFHDSTTGMSDMNHDSYLSSFLGCDSIITTTLDVFEVDTSITTTGLYNITANAIGVYYQWVDCGSNYDAITGATTPDYYPATSGYYAVIIYDGACEDTSACHSVITGIEEYDHNALVNMIVNLQQQKLNIIFNKQVIKAIITISDTKGSIVYKEKFLRINNAEIIISKFNQGLYLVNISADNQIPVTLKFIK